MSPLTISLEVTNDHPVPVEPSLGGSVTILNASGATLYYADGPRVSATDNQGTLTSGQSATFLLAQWLRSASLSSVTATVNDPPVASIAAIDADSPPLSAGPLALQVISEDITAAIQADINTNRGTIILPDGTSTISATITAPGGASLADLQFVGVGRRRTLLKLANGVNADMFNIAAGCGVKFRHLKFDGNRANNSSGHIINLPDSSGYQTSIEALDCDFANAAQDHIFAGAARNAGRLVLCNFGNAGTDGIAMNGADWFAFDCAFGSAVNHALNLVTATNFKIIGCDIFTGGVHGAYVGFQSKQVFFIGCKFNSNQQNAIFMDQWAGGQNFQNETNEHVVIGCTFTNNSAASSGTYSDIVVFGVLGAQISDNSFKFESTGNTKPKYHLEDKITTGPANGSAVGIQFLGNRFLSTALGGAGGFLSYGTGVTNLTNGVNGFVRIDSDTPVAPRASAARQTRRTLAQGFTDQTWDLWGSAAVAGQQAPTTQIVYGTMTGVLAGDVITNVWVPVGTVGVGTTPTAIFVAVYSLAGVRLAVSANLNASSIWTAAAQPVPAPLTTPYSVPADGAVYLCFLENGTWGTTQMQLLHGYQSALVQGHVLSGGSAFCVAQSGSTVMPTPASFALDPTNFWFGWN